MTRITSRNDLKIGIIIVLITSIAFGLNTPAAFALTEIDDCSDSIDADGETYILTQNLSIDGSTCLEIEANDVILDCQGYSITGNDVASTYGISVASQQNATIANCDVNDFQRGIRLSAGGNHTVEHSSSSDNTSTGIWVVGSDDNTLTHNFVSDNIYGIYLQDSSDNTVTHNTAEDNDRNIWLYRNSDDNQIVGNESNGGLYGILLQGSGANTPNYNQVTNNITSETIGARNSNTGYGIRVHADADYNNLVNNVSYDNAVAGFVIEDSDFNTLTNNLAYGNDFAGFEIDNSDENVIKNNKANDNENGFWMNASDSENNKYKNNKCSDNVDNSNPDGLCKS